MNQESRSQIERRIDRELTPDEVAEVPTLEDLTRTHLETAITVAWESELHANLYLRGVVPTGDRTDVREFVKKLEDIFAQRFPDAPPVRLRNEKHYEAALLRTLVPDERRAADSLASLSPAHLAVATRLALHNPVYAEAYVGEIVKSANDDECKAFAERLRREC